MRELTLFSISDHLARIAVATVATAVVTFCGCKIYNLGKEKSNKIPSKKIKEISTKIALTVAALTFGYTVLRHLNSLTNNVGYNIYPALGTLVEKVDALEKQLARAELHPKKSQYYQVHV